MWPFLVGIFLRIHKRIRRCPVCAGRQAVKAAQQFQTVRCRHCGAELPPPVRP